MPRHRWIGLAGALFGCLLAGYGWAELPGIKDVIAAVTVDFAGNGDLDRAVLVQGTDDSADLYLFMAAPGTAAQVTLTLTEMVHRAGYARSGERRQVRPRSAHGQGHPQWKARCNEVRDPDARTVVNAHDKAGEIAGFAKDFEAYLLANMVR
jgi:hypothetical protein